MTFEEQLRKWSLAGAVDLYGVLLVTEYGVVIDIGPEMAPTERYVVRGNTVASLVRKEREPMSESDCGLGDVGDIDRALDRLASQLASQHKETLALLHRIRADGKANAARLDTLIAMGGGSPEILSALTADLKKHDDELQQALKDFSSTEVKES